MEENLEPQAPAQDKTKLLYDAVSKDYNIGTYDDFSKKLQDSSKRKAFYDGVGAEYNLGTFDDFSAKIGGLDLKKKDQEVSLSVSSPTQSLSPDFEKGKAFAEKGFLMKPEGTKKQKRISIEPSFTSAIFGGAPNVKVLEEGEEPSALADISSAVIKGQIQGRVANILSAGKRPTENELGELAQLQTDAQLLPQSKSEKLYQEKGLKGLFVDSPALGVQFVAETMASSFSALFEASKRTVPTAVAMGAAAGAPIAGVGGLIGAGVGLLGGQSAAGYNLSTSQDILNSLSDNGVDISNKESLIKAFSDEKKMAKIRDTAAKYGVPILAFDIATAGLAGKFLSGAIGKSLSKKLLAGLGETGIQVGGGMGGDLSGQLASGKKVNWDDVVMEGLAAIPGGVTEVATGVAMERSKTASNNKTLATQIATQGVQNGAEDAVVNLNRDLANNVITPEQHQEGVVFVEKAAQVADKIPETVTGENKAKSIELLVERNDIKQLNDNLIQQKQSTDEAYHAGIDEEVKANEEKIKKIDSEVYNIAKKPAKETGTKKYTAVDGEEVTKEAFEALQGKPIGTKTVVKAASLPSPLQDIEGLKGEQPNIRTEATRKIVNAVRYLEGLEPYTGPLDKLTNVLTDTDEYHSFTIGSKLNNLEKAVEAVKNLPSYKGLMSEQAKAAESKPIAVKEEVKPTEVDLTSAEKMNASQNRYGIVKDGANAGFIVATNPENNVVKIKGVTVNEDLRGKNIAGDAYVKLGESLAKEGVSLESDSFDKMEPSATRVWEKLADKGLAVKGENSYQFKPTEVKVTEEPIKTFKSSQGVTVEFKDGKLVAKDKKGMVLSERASKKSIDEYASNFDYSKGERVLEVPSEITNERDVVRYALDNTNNPLEVAEIYSNEQPMPSENDAKMQAIAEYGLGRIKTSSYKKFGDINNIEKSMYLNIFSQAEGIPIDVLAKSISDKYEGLNIEPKDIVDYIEKYSRGDSKALKLQETDVQILAKEKFKSLTGLDLNDDLANKILEKELEKLNKNQLEILKEDYETAKQFEDAYWEAYAETDGFTKESPISEVKPTEATEKSLEEAYKDLTIIEKRQINNSKFDEILEELKIEKICQ